MQIGIVIQCSQIKDHFQLDALINFLARNNEYVFCFVNDRSNVPVVVLLEETKHSTELNIHIINVKRGTTIAESLLFGIGYLSRNDDVDYYGYINENIIISLKGMKCLTKALITNEDVSIVFARTRNEKIKLQLIDDECDMASTVDTLKFDRYGGLRRTITYEAVVFTSSIIPILFTESFVSYQCMDIELLLRLKSFVGRKNMKGHFRVVIIQGVGSTKEQKLSATESLKMLYIFYLKYGFFDFLRADKSKSLPSISS
ncbi:hypothetical protein [Ulvibacter antarcticus]|uniref:Glycosyl transferase family 2 n=1 Tax=Ulvibacter antarcticus TaxID=442714 RepID=A0A3L9Z7K0_9FLAO|nr:hypothetical protein [Ulvibacter antarcticus]RMA66418.1 hypothetical protein BXY75_0842 [Ulvibacter antarcticus]